MKWDDNSFVYYYHILLYNIYEFLKVGLQNAFIVRLLHGVMKVGGVCGQYEWEMNSTDISGFLFTVDLQQLCF